LLGLLDFGLVLAQAVALVLFDSLDLVVLEAVGAAPVLLVDLFVVANEANLVLAIARVELLLFFQQVGFAHVAVREASLERLLRLLPLLLSAGRLLVACRAERVLLAGLVVVVRLPLVAWMIRP